METTGLAKLQAGMGKVDSSRQARFSSLGWNWFVGLGQLKQLDGVGSIPISTSVSNPNELSVRGRLSAFSKCWLKFGPITRFAMPNPSAGAQLSVERKKEFQRERMRSITL